LGGKFEEAWFVKSEGNRNNVEIEDTPETEIERFSFSVLRHDLQKNYTDHLKSIEKASFGILDSVVKSARLGFQVSLVLNVLSFVLGTLVIITGLGILLWSPENIERIMGVVFSLLGTIFVLVVLFWKGPLERILESVSNLAKINVITIGLAHRLNQISQVFVQESLKGQMSPNVLRVLNQMIYEAVHHSVEEFSTVLPQKRAEDQVQEMLSGLRSMGDTTSDTTSEY